MKNYTQTILIVLIGITFFSFSRLEKNNFTRNKFISNKNFSNSITADSVFYVTGKAMETFFKNYPDLKKYQSEVETLYKNRNYNVIWYGKIRINELGHLLYNRVNEIQEDGLKSKMPYKKTVDQVFTEYSTSKPSKIDTELLLTSMYVFYASNALEGLNNEKVKEIGWYLPKRNISYEKILDSLLISPEQIDNNKTFLFSQYYKLQDALKKYLELQKTENLGNIVVPSNFTEIKPYKDSTNIISQIRHRLYVFGDLKEDTKSNQYHEDMMAGVLNFKKRNGLTLNYTITQDHIALLNKPISEYVKTIMVNMERCRWIDPKLEKAPKYVMINIPSFHLFYVVDGKYALASDVYVGTPLSETVIFSSHMDRIVFSPYWNVPASIVEHELKSQIAMNKNYLEENNMEEVGKGRYRQKPGPNNSLGLVKFMFPNPNDIYLHDTPNKSLFNFERRIFSHGCINVKEAKKLAIEILKDNPEWPVEKINDAMSGEKEITCPLKEKIPIHIGYFTSWVQDNGEINFFEDVYKRDDRLYKMMFSGDNLGQTK